MTGLDLRPLSLGEILDRTFFLYRRHFVLFVGISAVPQILVLAYSLTRIFLMPIGLPSESGILSGMAQSLFFTLILLIVAFIAYLFSQGATVLAVSEVYLGRTTTIGGSLSRVMEDLGPLFGVVFLSGLVVGIGTMFFIIPGIYLACRLLVSVPAAMIEKRGATESMRRSFDLTRDFVIRAFVMIVLYVILVWAIQALLSWPFAFALVLARNDPVMVRFWSVLTQLGSSVGSVLVSPILLISTALYYYDLRVRKEAFDLQIMMDPNSQWRGGPGPTPSILG